MFVDVENINYSAIECDTLIKKARNKKGELTPDLALSSLRLTNHIANMKLIVANIYAIKDKNKRLAFKDVVIAMVERRVQSESVMEKLRALAIEGGYEKEFDEANAKTKWLGKQVCQRAIVNSYYQFNEGKKKLQPPVLCKDEISYYYKEVDYVSFGGSEFRAKNCEFTSDAEINLFRAEKVCLEGIKLMPVNFPFANCDVVELFSVNLEGVEKVELKDMAKVTFDSVRNIKDIDFSKCYTLNLNNCDLYNIKELKFDSAWMVNITGCKNLPEVLDFSNVDKVDLSGTDLSGVKEIKFKDGARVVFDNATNLPQNLDVSMCASATFNLTDMSGVENLKIKNEQKLERLKEFPQNIDCAECETFLGIGFVDLTKIKEISNAEGKNLFLYDSYNMPKNVDFSDFEKVHMQYTCLNKGTQDDSVQDCVKIKAKELVIEECYKYPKVFDLSECDSVTIDKSSLDEVENIIFKEGADVFIWGCYGMPKNIDVSMCGSVKFSSCRMANVKEIKFRDEAQYRNAVEYIEGFEGNIVIANNSNSAKVVVRNSDLEF